MVKEVERLKKNREERRLKQAELKETKEALMSQEPNNPNWDFINMIRFVTRFMLKKALLTVLFSSEIIKQVLISARLNTQILLKPIKSPFASGKGRSAKKVPGLLCCKFMFRKGLVY